MPLPVYLYLIPVDHPSQKLVENDHYKTRLSLKKKSATNYPLWPKVGHFTFLVKFLPKKKLATMGTTPVIIFFSYHAEMAKCCCCMHACMHASCTLPFPPFPCPCVGVAGPCVRVCVCCDDAMSGIHLPWRGTPLGMPGIALSLQSPGASHHRGSPAHNNTDE